MAVSRPAATLMLLHVDAFRAALKELDDRPAWISRAERRLAQKISRLFTQAGAAAVAELLRREDMPTDRAALARIAAHLDGARPAFLAAIAEAADQSVRNGRRSTIDKAGSFVQSPPADPPPDLVERVRNRRLRFADETITRVTGTVADSLAASAADGLGIEEAAERLGEVTDGLRTHEAERIARTEINGAQSEAAFETMRELGVVYQRWLTNLDGRERDSHHRVNGEIVRVGGLFSHSLRYPHDWQGPAKETVNCFPAWTLVEAPGVEAAYRRWYEGELVEVRTAAGRVLAATPNHPVLTVRGRVALGEIVEGDHLVRCLGGDGTTATEPDVQAEPATIAQVADALRVAFDVERVAGKAGDFHGDGRDGEIEVVRADGELRHRVASPSAEELEQFVLGAASAHERLLVTERDLRSMLLRVRLAANGSVRRRGESLPLLGGGAGHPHVHRLGATTRLDSSLAQAYPDRESAAAEGIGEGLLRVAGQVARDDLVRRQLRSPASDRFARVGQDSADHGLSTAVGAGERNGRFPGAVAADDVVSVERKPFRGHVYNLQTATGWYRAEGIIVHNCRCLLVPFLMPPGKAAPARSGPFKETDLVADF